MNKKIIFIGLLVLVAISFGLFLYYRDTVFSKEILKLRIQGPDSVSMGEEFEYTVKYKNNGNFILQSPKITFELPENSLTEDGKTRFTQDIEDINPGAESSLKFRARLLGQEGDLKVARAVISYVPKNLSVRYESETSFTTKIDKVFLTLNFDLPSKVERGKDFDFSLNYFSNTNYPLENLSVKISPIAGVKIKSADPSSLDNIEWKLQTLSESQGGRINIKALVGSEASQSVDFVARLGMWQDGDFIVIKEVQQSIEVINPLISVRQEVNGLADYVATPGETLNYGVFLKNASATPFDNLSLVSYIEGNAFDAATLQSASGRVDKGAGSVTWNYALASQLKKIDPGQEVKISFSVKLKDSWDVEDSQKNNITVKNRILVFDNEEEFSVKVNSKLELSQRAYYSSINGVVNSGPIPPMVGSATTYAINWQAKNYFNDLKNVKVKATLPKSVDIGGIIFPVDQIARFSFDSVSRQIVWQIGSLAPGDSVSLTFQIVLTPESSQKWSVVSLIGPATILAEDQSTQSQTQYVVSSVSTRLPDDASNSGGGVVQ